MKLVLITAAAVDRRKRPWGEVCLSEEEENDGGEEDGEDEEDEDEEE